LESLCGSAAPFVEVRNGSRGFAIFDTLFQILSFVGGELALAESDFHFDAAFFPIHPQSGNREAFALDGSCELVDLRSV
jgi:hypothetical protein